MGKNKTIQEKVDDLLSTDGILTDIKNKARETALDLARAAEHVEIIDWL
jgi:hypothetical protein